MKFSRSYAVMAQITLVLAFLGCFLMMAILVQLAWETGIGFPEVSHLVLPYSLAAVATVVCIQVLIFAVFMLVRAVKRGEFFSPKTRRWFTVAQVSVIVGPAIEALTWLHTMFFTDASHIVQPLGFLGGVVLGLGLFALVGLAKSIFDHALENESELEGVI